MLNGRARQHTSGAGVHAKPRSAVHFTIVHPPRDPRIFHKECVSLAAAGWDVTQVAQGRAPPEIVDGVRCLYVPVPRSRAARATVGQLRMFLRLLRLEADVFHFHDPELLLSGLGLRMLGRRVVFDSHENIAHQFGAKPYLKRWQQRIARLLGRVIERVACRTMSGIIVVTEGGQDAYRGARNLAVVRNLPLRSSYHANSRKGEGGPCIYVGSISVARGALLMAHLAEEGVPVVAAGPIAPSDLPAIQAHPGWPKVDYRGVVPQAEVPELLAAAAVGLCLLLPTDNYLRAYPTKLFEYMAAGLPGVVSDFALYRELCKGVPCASFVDPSDTGAVLRAVRELMDDPQRSLVMGCSGRRLVEEQYVWEAEADRLLHLYDSLSRGR